MATNNTINRPNVGFLYSAVSAQTAVTGDGTIYTLIYTNKIYDPANVFDGTSTMTAPISGLYFIQFAAKLQNLGSALYTLVDTQIVTTSYIYDGNLTNPYNTTSIVIPYYELEVAQTAIVRMAASDTLTTTVQVSLGAKNIDIQGLVAPHMRTWIGGYLITEL